MMRKMRNRFLLDLICVLGVVGGVSPSAALAAGQILVIDATADPGVDLLVTFVPQSSVEGGTRRIAAHQSVVTTAFIGLSAALQVDWMVSVLKTGDVAANISTRPVSDRNGHMLFVFPNEMTVVLDNGEWQIPNFDSSLYAVEVGFGIESNIVQSAYSVQGRPGQRLKMAPGNYQVVRSDGEARIGTPIRPDLETWDIPSNMDSLLTFNSRGEGTLGLLR